MSAKKNDELAVAGSNSVQNLEDYAGYEAYVGDGFEGTSSEDYSIPFIGILQALSPQLEADDTLRAGMIINTVTGDAFPGKDGICFVPATTVHNVVEFKPRDSGGGFVGLHEMSSPVVERAKNEAASYGDWKTPEGNDLIETFNMYGIVVDNDGNSFGAVISFSGSKIKKYKAWMTKARMVQIQLPDGRRIPAPLYAHRYRLTTVSEKNNKGSYYNWEVKFDGEDARSARLPANHELVQQARDLKEVLESGKAKANYEQAGSEASGHAPQGDEPF